MTSLLAKLRDLTNALVRGPRPIKVKKTKGPAQSQSDPVGQRTASTGRLGQDDAEMEGARVVDLLKKDQAQTEGCKNRPLARPSSSIPTALVILILAQVVGEQYCDPRGLKKNSLAVKKNQPIIEWK